MKKENYLIAYVYQERKSFSCSNISNLKYQKLREFDKGYRGLNDKFISNFITIIVTVQKNLCSGNTFMSVFRMLDTCSSRVERVLAK